MAKLNEATNTQSEKPTWDAEPNPMFDGFAKGEPYGHFEIDTLRFNEFQRGWLECEAVNQHYGLKAENQKLKDALEFLCSETMLLAVKAGQNLDSLAALNSARFILQSNNQALSGDK
jgi:hypothetical protein